MAAKAEARRASDAALAAAQDHQREAKLRSLQQVDPMPQAWACYEACSGRAQDCSGCTWQSSVGLIRRRSIAPSTHNLRQRLHTRVVQWRNRYEGRHPPQSQKAEMCLVPKAETWHWSSWITPCMSHLASRVASPAGWWNSANPYLTRRALPRPTSSSWSSHWPPPTRSSRRRWPNGSRLEWRYSVRDLSPLRDQLCCPVASGKRMPPMP